MKITATAKVAAVATSLAMAMSLLSFAPMASAAGLTQANIDAIVGLLVSFNADAATVANVKTSLSGGSPVVATTPALGIGSKGAAVTALQDELIAGGYLKIAKATGYYGTLTAAAVAARAAAMVIVTPASTVAGCSAGAMFSSISGLSCSATYPAGCSAGTVFSSTTGQSCASGTVTTTGGALTGAGRLTNVSSLGDVKADVKEGDAATAVIGVSADAKNGDVSIQRVDVTFNMAIGPLNGSTNLNQYVSDVSLYLGSTKLASMDPALGDKSSNIWTLRFSGLNGVIKSGTTGNLYVKVTPLTSIGTLEDGDSITAGLAIDSVRAVGGDGISDTYVSTAVTQLFTVSSATVGTLTVTAAGDNPTASQIAVASSTTTGVKLLSFNMKAKNSALTVTDIKAQFVTSDDNLSDVVNTVYLMKGSTVIKSKTLSTGTSGFVTFTTVNQTLAKDATDNYTLVVDLKGDSLYADGTTLIASTTITGWDVVDANGASVSPSAAAVGNTQTLTGTGISVAKGTPSFVTTVGLTTAGDSTQYTLPFTVTAGDNDVFIGSVVTRATTPSASAGGVNFATTTSSTEAVTGTATTNFSAANVVTGDVAGAFKVLAGTSRTFTLNVSFTATSTGYTGVIVTGINYGPTSTLGTTYYTSNLDTFKTTDVRMQLR